MCGCFLEEQYYSQAQHTSLLETKSAYPIRFVRSNLWSINMDNNKTNGTKTAKVTKYGKMYE